MKIAKNEVHSNRQEKSQPVKRVMPVKGAVYSAFSETFPCEKVVDTSKSPAGKAQGHHGNERN